MLKKIKYTPGELIRYEEILPLNKPHPYSSDTRIVSSYNISSLTPVVSVIVPVYNKEKSIVSVLNKISDNMVCPYEFIIIDDASTDDSLNVINCFLNQKKIQHLILENSKPIYETACDNLGFALARGNFLLEIQSDIHIINDYGFDRRLIDLFLKYNLGSISGRAGHSWLEILRPWSRLTNILRLSSSATQLLSSYRGVGMLGNLVFSGKPHPTLNKEDFYYVDTNNRGPWLTSKDVINKIGFLDSNNFFLGGDDHEFNFRCSLEGLLCGYNPVNFVTYADEGSTRQVRTGDNKVIFDYLNSNKSGYSKLLQKIHKMTSSRPLKIEPIG